MVTTARAMPKAARVTVAGATRTRTAMATETAATKAVTAVTCLWTGPIHSGEDSTKSGVKMTTNVLKNLASGHGLKIYLIIVVVVSNKK